MNLPGKFHPSLRNAVTFSFALQIPILLLAFSVADHGETLQMCSYAFLAFNAFLCLLIFRRRASPTTMDLVIIRGGFIPTIIQTYVAARYLWEFRYS